MHREIEAKILNINPEEVQEKLRGLGAILKQELDLEQIVWWIPNTEKRSSVRVRKASDGSIRLTMKQKVTEGLGYNEWELDVSNYEHTAAIIDALLPNPELRLEYSHRRQDWYLGDTLINIDWFPRLAPLVEIEAKSEEKVREVAEQLGFNPSQLLNKGVISLLFEEFGLKIGDKVKLN